MRFLLPFAILLFTVSCQTQEENPPSRSTERSFTESTSEVPDSSSASAESGNIQKLDPQESELSQAGCFGKVKSLKIWKASFNPKGKLMDEKIDEEFTFNENGRMLSSREYDHAGKLKRTEDFVYDLQNKKISSSSKVEAYARREKYARNDTGATIVNLSGNEIISTSYLELDQFDRIIKMSGYGKDDTLINQYFFDENHRLVKEIRFNNKTNITRTVINDFQYNSDGLLTEETRDFGSDRAQVFMYDYKDLKLDQKKLLFGGKLRSITKYDEFGNIALIEYYQKADLRKSERYTYVFDEQNNWTSYQKDIKMHSSETANYRPSLKVRRLVEYH